MHGHESLLDILTNLYMAKSATKNSSFPAQHMNRKCLSVACDGSYTAYVYLTMHVCTDVRDSVNALLIPQT